MTSDPKAILEVTQLCKAYPGVVALDHVTLTLKPGEVRALMGKNGAGKSTLVKTLSGATIPDSGTITFQGKPVSFLGPVDALAAGIATVYQELNTVPSLTVAENITLGHWPSKYQMVDYDKMNAMALRALDMLGETIPLDRLAGELSIAERQICEIAHALSSDPKILILDEPTSSLPAHEVERVIGATSRIAAAGTAVIYVSHRMDEIERVADSVTVIRDGKAIATLPIDEAPVDQIARLMVGEDYSESVSLHIHPPGEEVLLSLEQISSGERVKNINLQLKAGEVVGIAGLLGAGRSELLRSIAGADGITGGQISVLGEPFHTITVAKQVQRGVTLVPEDRKAEGLVLEQPVASNLVASCLQKIAGPFGILRKDREKKMTENSRDELDIKCDDLQMAVSSLSGGNQQKIVLGRCLNAGARVLLLDEPTRGVDVHAKAQIYDLIVRVAGQGLGVIFVSSEYEELLPLCHRILVMRDGAFVGELNPETENIDSLLAAVLETKSAQEIAVH